MTSKPMAERSRSDHGASTAPPFLSPESAQGASGIHTFTPTHDRLLPSPIPPPTASSVHSQRPQSRVSSAVSGLSRTSEGDTTAVRKSHSQSVSSTPHTLASSNRTLSAGADNKERQRAARTLPSKPR